VPIMPDPRMLTIVIVLPPKSQNNVHSRSSVKIPSGSLSQCHRGLCPCRAGCVRRHRRRCSSRPSREARPGPAQPSQGVSAGRNMPVQREQLYRMFLRCQPCELTHQKSSFGRNGILLQKILSKENEASNCCINSVSLEKQCLSCLFFAKESVEHLSF